MKSSSHSLFWTLPPAPKGSGLTVLRAEKGRTLVLRSLGHRQLSTSAPRWPRTLAGITAYQSCLQYPFTSVPLSGGAPGTRASRRCDRAGRWEPGDYSHCLYTNDITRVLYTFVLVRPGWGWRPWGRGRGRGEAGWPHGAGGPCVLGRHGEEPWGQHRVSCSSPLPGVSDSPGPHLGREGHPDHLCPPVQQGPS